jgi:hypothetical protein
MVSIFPSLGGQDIFLHRIQHVLNSFTEKNPRFSFEINSLDLTNMREATCFIFLSYLCMPSFKFVY